MRRFFDTNVLVYAQDKGDATKRALARQRIEEAISDESFVLSTQVLLEFYATALRRQLLTPPAALALVRVWSEQEVVNTTPDLLMRGFQLQQRHQLSVWDALIIQAALDANCDTIYSEDLQDGMRFEDLTVVNPFAKPTAAHQPVAQYRGKRR